MTEEIQYDFFDLDGAIFRRPRGHIGGVTDVFRERTKTWELYGGDRTKPALFGDRCPVPRRSTD